MAIVTFGTFGTFGTGADRRPEHGSIESRSHMATQAPDRRTPSMQMLLAGDLTEIDLASLQGSWSEEQYLRLTQQTNRLLEFTDGVIEVLPMPTRKHQAISRFL